MNLLIFRFFPNVLACDIFVHAAKRWTLGIHRLQGTRNHPGFSGYKNVDFPEVDPKLEDQHVEVQKLTTKLEDHLLLNELPVPV